MLQFIKDFAENAFGLGSLPSSLVSFVVLSIFVFLLCTLADFIAKTYLVRLFNLFISKAYSKLSNFLEKREVASKLARTAPALVLYLASPAFYSEKLAFTVPLIFILKQGSVAYIIFTLIRSLLSFLDVIEDVYNQYEVSKKRPIKSYLQIGKIVFTFFGFVLFVSLLLDRSPLAFFTGLGAAATILVLIFKDSIMSFLASVQLASYDMIRIGDWIEVSKYGADGDVIEISLTTVKVRNFDKTITTIPTYALVTEGVKNWRGMQESGGRRIKRSIRLDLNSISFCDAALKNKLKEDDLLKSFSSSKAALLAFDQKDLSNASLFRAYVEHYLLEHKDIYSNSSFTFLIRELQPDEHGLPIEIYIFTKTTNWVSYESIQADIFDHLFAIMPHFQLRAFQSITGSDVLR